MNLHYDNVIHMPGDLKIAIQSLVEEKKYAGS